ncbi:MAG: RNA polymerase sigma factor [Flavobacteriales bacterium]|uniref:RNA polymerase sigma factor n=1 Tax=Sanyastnella coralliicola TaxID=3069118 RepID=UPI0027B9DB1C|nr:RNA polymerase sigma factor [Longitalea sp. SCSIO 12813]MCH2197391.1 RNA polymerase sigma factor [Flavobacteriales bacterium]
MTVAEYNECVHSFADNLFRFIVKNLRDEEQARDIVQDTFAKLWLKVEDVPYAKCKSYLFTTGYRTMIDWIRREKKNADFENVNQKALSHDRQYSDLSEILQDALDRIPEMQRNVIMLRDYEGYSYQEIGEITGLNESQVKVYIYRGRVALKNYLVSIDQLI